MDRSLALLSDRERDVLRLLGRGHDTKSAAGTLGLSVHTINDHLRSARGKLGVNSSREAARLLAEHEEDAPQENRDKSSGIGTPTAATDDVRRTAQSVSVRTLVAISGGAAMLSLAALVTAIYGYYASPSTAAASGSASSPKVVSTTPISGGVVSPGPFILSVTFDRPMLDQSYSFVQLSAETAPQCDGHAVLSGDGRKFSMKCTAVAGRRYQIGFNRPPYMNFKSVAGQSAIPAAITFYSNLARSSSNTR